MRLTEQYLFAFIGWPELLVLALVAGAIAFWIWMIVDCANHENPGGTKVCWLLVILLAGIIGAPLYFVMRRLPRSTARSSPPLSFQAPSNSEVEFRTVDAAEAATGARLPAPSILKEAGSREVSAAATSTVRDCRPVQSSGTSKMASALSPTDTEPAPQTDYDVFDTSEFRRLEADGVPHYYHQSWSYFVRGRDRVFHKSAEPFISPKRPKQSAALTSPAKSEAASLPSDARRVRTPQEGLEPPDTVFDVFDDAEFERLSSEGTPFYYQQSWCYHVKEGSRVFVKAAQAFITARERPTTANEPQAEYAGIESRLRHLKSLYEKGLITSSEFSAKKSDILQDL